MAQVPLCAHDGAELFDVLLHGAIDDCVAVIAPAFHFLGRIAHPDLDLFVGLRATAKQSAAQLLQIGWQEEDVGKRAQDERITAGADVRGPMGVDVEEDIDAVAEILEHGTLERSVMVPVHLRMLEELPRIAVPDKLLP